MLETKNEIANPVYPAMNILQGAYFSGHLNHVTNSMLINGMTSWPVNDSSSVRTYKPCIRKYSRRPRASCWPGGIKWRRLGVKGQREVMGPVSRTRRPENRYLIPLDSLHIDMFRTRRLGNALTAVYTCPTRLLQLRFSCGLWSLNEVGEAHKL